MADKIIIPQFGANIEEAVIIEWLVSEGDLVEMGDPIVVVETIKSAMEIEAEDDGKILQIIHRSGKHNVGSVIGFIGDEDESLIEKEG
ncbi:MAG: hypothetical protein PF904_17810 [Kiritimatiellae bacterium]|jgi:pyruvate/2-oxoglutarate dehydrogenase complex dihydrolipoamide acyltransferase (E2) component|nr:hypothetical protein [Kiritimatiellia bacterium]